MSESSFLKRRWKLILNILTLVALGVLIYAIRQQLADTLSNLGKVHLWALLLLVPLEAWNYDAQTRMYRCLFATLGNKLSYGFFMKLSLELNFINHVFPSGGVSGISYFSMRMRSNEITGGRATLVQLMKLVLIFISFEILVVAGLLIMAIAGRANDLVILITGSLTTAMIIGTFGFVYVVGKKERITTFFTFLTHGLNRLIRIVRPHHPETISIERVRATFDELHENYVLFRKKLPELRAPFIYGLICNITEVMAVYVVFIAFGEWVNLGAVILAYAIANFAGFISVLPGGVGVYEALMTGVMAIAGVPPALTIPVVVMYRVVNTVIQLPPGYYLYHKALQGNKQPVETS